MGGYAGGGAPAPADHSAPAAKASPSDAAPPGASGAGGLAGAGDLVAFVPVQRRPGTFDRPGGVFDPIAEKDGSAVFLQFVKLLKIESFRFFLTIFIEYVTHTSFVAITTVTVSIKPVFQSLSCSQKIYFG